MTSNPTIVRNQAGTRSTSVEPTEAELEREWRLEVLAAIDRQTRITSVLLEQIRDAVKRLG
jgi:hypothetical protein